MVMQHHEPESCRHFVGVAILKVKVTAKVKNVSEYLSG